MVSAAKEGRARRVLRNSGMLAVTKVLERASSLVLALLIAATLGVDGLGVFATAQAVYGLIALAGEGGIVAYLVREISRDPARTPSYTVHFSAIALVVGTVLLLVAELVTPRLGYSGELETSVSIVLLAILPKLLNNIQEAVFISHGRVEFEALTRLCASVASVGVSAWLLTEGYGVPAVLIVFVTAEYTIAAVYFILISRFVARLRLEFRWALALRLIREVKAFTGLALLAALTARPEIVILSLLATESEVGLYSAAVRIAELPILLPEVLMANIFPLLSQSFQAAEDRFSAWQTTAVRAILAYSLPVAACFLVAAEPILLLVFDERFAPAAPILRVLSLNVVLFALIAIFWRSLTARRRQNQVLALQVLLVGVRVGGGAALIVPFGGMGAAVASVGGSALHVALLARATARSGAPPRVLRAGWRFALAAAATGLVVWLLVRALPLPVALVAGGLAYLVTALAVRAVTPEDRLQLRRVRSKRAAPSER
jgi:O-antigen/teichoic acid export membrane protein